MRRKKITISLILRLSILGALIYFHPERINAQKVKSIYGKVIEINTIDKKKFNENIYFGGIKYYYGIAHIKILTHQKDTVFLGLVYSFLDGEDSVAKRFGLNLTTPYEFLVSEFTPCESDFPQIRGCDCKTGGDCLIIPEAGQIIDMPYKKISRVIFYIKLTDDLWQILTNN